MLSGTRKAGAMYPSFLAPFFFGAGYLRVPLVCFEGAKALIPALQACFTPKCDATGRFRKQLTRRSKLSTVPIARSSEPVELVLDNTPTPSLLAHVLLPNYATARTLVVVAGTWMSIEALSRQHG